MNRAGHPALLMVDTISSLASVEYKHEAWGVDVTVAGSQKGLMLPPGLSFTRSRPRRWTPTRRPACPAPTGDWQEMLANNGAGFFPYTPATNLLYGLREAITMLQEEGLDNVFARHARHGAATRAAARHWGLEILCLDERLHSNVLTALVMPDGHDADIRSAKSCWTITTCRSAPGWPG